MRVLAHDPVVAGGRLADGVEPAGFDACDSPSRDFVSLHARASPENENLMAAPQFAAMRPARSSSTRRARRWSTRTRSYAALASGHLAARRSTSCGRSPGRNPLLDMRNVVITPHIGGATAETLERGVPMVAEEIDAVRAWRRPLRFGRVSGGCTRLRSTRAPAAAAP